MPKKHLLVVAATLVCNACISTSSNEQQHSKWQLIDNFESGLERWTHIDVDNNTDPFVADPQVAEIRIDRQTGDRFLLRKPAVDGVVGNRKAIGFAPLPVAVDVGETYTFYTRFNVEYFPNNHSFGLANVPAGQIGAQSYDAFELMIRVTDKFEGNGFKNDGALQVLGDGAMRYSNIVNPATGRSAQPLQSDEWYEVWYVVNNASRDEGGQRYDLYVRGGEFAQQALVFENAVFRMGRTLPLTFFMTICNTGSQKKPYGNGGVRYDDIYMTAGRELTSPVE
ncbi:MAG: hypothetical protein AAF004_08845 [Pseudomonadota bacterium]